MQLQQVNTNPCCFINKLSKETFKLRQEQSSRKHNSSKSIGGLQKGFLLSKNELDGRKKLHNKKKNLNFEDKATGSMSSNESADSEFLENFKVTE